MSYSDCIVRGDATSLDFLDDESVHAVVCDPPYNLAFMGKDWDSTGTPEEYQEWCEEWASEALRVLKPGGHLIAFSSSRTHHRLFSGVEDAGFEVRDSLTWHYGSGFPKGSDVGKMIDKWGDRYTEKDVRKVCEWLRAEIQDSGEAFETVADHMGVVTSMVASHWAAKPEHKQPQCPSKETLEEILDVIGASIDDASEDVLNALYRVREATGEYSEHWDGREVVETRYDSGRRDIEILTGDGQEYDVTAATRDVSKQWEGWRSQLKPATEFAVLARKPLSESAIYKNVLEHGTGALNIDGCRIPTEESWEGRDMPDSDTGVALDGSKSGELNQQSSSSHDDRRYPANLLLDPVSAAILDEQSNDASRFFYNAKASKSERTHDGRVENKHPTVKPVDVMAWLVRLVTAEGQTVLDPFAGSGTTALACIREGRRFVCVDESAEYVELSRERAACEVSAEDDSGGIGGEAVADD